MTHLRDARQRRAGPTAAVLAAALLVSLIGSLALGTEPVPLRAVVDVVGARLTGHHGADATADVIVWELRVPRALLAAVVGAGLTLAGLTMQTLVRNPLADPYLLGVSSGAGVGATAVLTTGVLGGWGTWALSGGALLGALGASVVVYLVASAQGGLTPLRLVLSGVVLSSAFSAVASFLVFAAQDSRAAQSVLFWLLGNLTGATWAKVGLPAVVVLVAGVLLLAGSGWMDALAAGPDTAASLGVPVVGHATCPVRRPRRAGRCGGRGVRGDRLRRAHPAAPGPAARRCAPPLAGRRRGPRRCAVPALGGRAGPDAVPPAGDPDRGGDRGWSAPRSSCC